MVEMPEALLAERRRHGHDRWDEMWEGLLHVVPPPSARHQRIEGRFVMVLGPLAEARGLVVLPQAGLFRPGTDRDYRVPDLLVARPEHVRERGVEGPAELVVEIRSPGDETYEKLPFYGELGCREVLVVDRDSLALELFVLRGGTLHAALPDEAGRLRLQSLGVTVSTTDRPSVRVEWEGDGADVEPA
jgi:Uma2 family endonuclease